MSQRKVNADGLYEVLHRIISPNRAGPIQEDLDAAFPLAKPKPKPYGVPDHGVGGGYDREDLPDAKPEPTKGGLTQTALDTVAGLYDVATPEAWIDDRVYEAWWRAWCKPADPQPYTQMTAWAKDAVDAAVRKDRELRGGRACGGSSDCSGESGVSGVSGECTHPKIDAPAATGAVLTKDELVKAYRSVPPEADWTAGLRAVAAAQHAKSQALVSKQKILDCTPNGAHGMDVVDYLRSLGVRVEDTR